MDGRRLKRLPVVDEAGRLIGILSRSDLLRVFLRPDHAIREEIRDDIVRDTLRLNRDSITANVKEGQVTLSGTVELRSEQLALVRLCRAVDGVVGVTDHLGFRTDDTPLPPGGAAHTR
jgi:CBS domain-containing protein